MSYSISHVLDIKAHLGECPVWSVREQVLYFVDILAPALHRFDPATGTVTTMKMPEHTGCYGLREQGGFVAAMRSGVFLLDQAGNIESQVANNPTDPSKSRFNDGRVDAFGNFWCGTIWEPRDHKGGKLCRLDTQLNFTIQAEDVLVSNGAGFSPNADTMYHSDTPNHVIYQYPIQADQSLGARQIFKSFPQGQGRPDGAAVDSEGCYWSALFDGGKIVRLSPKGEILETIELPVKWPTMVAFGGKDLTTLYITSSRENRTTEELAQYPLSGDLFSIKVHTPGRAEPLFKG